MKIVKGIWQVVCYPFLYIVLQFLSTIICTFTVGIIVGVKNADRITTMTQLEIAELVMASLNIQIVLLINAILVFFIMYLILRKSWKQTGFWKAEGLKATTILLCIVLGVGMNLFTVGAMSLTHLTDLFPNYNNLIDMMLGNNFVLEIICLALLVPFLEEVIFRGVVFGRLKKMTKLPVALVLQAALFGLIHFNVLQGAYAFIVGIVIGLVCLWLNSIWAAVTVHIAYNLTSVVAVSLTRDIDISVMGFVVMTATGVAIATSALIVCRNSKRQGIIEVTTTEEM